jgi:hypothetical protein
MEQAHDSQWAKDFGVGPQFDRVHRIKLTQQLQQGAGGTRRISRRGADPPGQRIGISPPLSMLNLLRSRAIMDRDRRP